MQARSLGPLLAATSALLAAHGLLNALLAVRAAHLGFSTTLIGLTTSAYFVGYLVGSRWMPGLVPRLGHVRVFAACAALATIAVLLLPLWPTPTGWVLLRGLLGVALVGLSMVLESWLGGAADAQDRSRVLGLYMTVNLLALAAGPLLLALAPAGSPLLFSLAAILLAAAALPVVLTPFAPPPVESESRLPLREVLKLAPSAFIGIVLAGVALGAFWGLGAVHAEQAGLDRAGIGALLSLTVLGGALAQWPIGRWSDRGDRRSVLSLVSLGGAIALGAAALARTPPVLLGAFAMAGMALFAIYPLCMAHVFDRLPQGRAVAACSVLMLANGVGAAAGPLLVGAAMDRAPSALPWAMAGCLLMIGLVASARRWATGPLRRHAARFQPMLRTSLATLRLLESDAKKSAGA